ncbi:hypothetical protein C2S52_018351 [Perilla frutescens var. hirtella]|nr:hypothetical protein C2S52_018351 [Perilla frutescens var. hirtella]
MENQILEINLISAQGLKTPSSNLRKMQTYALTWVNPAAKLRTRVDSLGGENPTWNDKFLFRVSDDFISGDTSAVSVEIFAVGYIRDFLIGTVRFLLSTCLTTPTTPRAASAIQRSIGIPAFTAVQIRRPSGRFQGVLNIASAVYYSSDYPILDKVSAVSFRELMEKKERDSRRLRRLSRGGSRRSQHSSGGESCDFSDADSTTSSSSSASTALKEWNCVREMAGKMKGAKSNGGGLLCGLMVARKIPSYPSDQNLDTWGDSFEGMPSMAKKIPSYPSDQSLDTWENSFEGRPSMARKIPSYPSDQSLDTWDDSFEGRPSMAKKIPSYPSNQNLDTWEDSFEGSP